MKRFSQHPVGTSLIEVVLTVTLITFLGIVAIDFARMLLEQSYHIRAQQEVVSTADVVTRQLESLVHNAQSIIAPAAGTSGSVLQLLLPDPPHSPATVSLNGTTLQLSEGAALAALPLTNSHVTVTGVQFTTLLPGSIPAVRVQFTLSTANPQSSPEGSYTQTFTNTIRLIR